VSLFLNNSELIIEFNITSDSLCLNGLSSGDYTVVAMEIDPWGSLGSNQISQEFYIKLTNDYCE